MRLHHHCITSCMAVVAGHNRLDVDVHACAMSMMLASYIVLTELQNESEGTGSHAPQANIFQVWHLTEQEEAR